MIQVDNLSDDADQVTKVVLDDGTTVTLELIYRPAVEIWTISITHGDFEIDNIQACVHANLLRGFRNNIPFGLACNTTDGVDPFDIEDFNNGRASLYILNPSDIALIEENVFEAAS